MHSARPIVYVASGVTNAPDSFRDFVQDFKQKLRATTSALVLEWIERDSPAVVDDFFRRDLNNVSLCDVMIALVDEPSIGLGMEIEKAIVEKKRILCLHNEKNKVLSRLLMSAQDSVGLPISSYDSLDEAVRIVSVFITQTRSDGSLKKIHFMKRK